MTSQPTHPFKTLVNQYGIPAFLAMSLLGLTGCHLFQGQSDPKETMSSLPTLADEDTLLEVEADHQPLIKNYRPLTVKTKDGVELNAVLYVPGLSPYRAPPSHSTDKAVFASTKSSPHSQSKKPLIILIHSLSHDQWGWKNLPQILVEMGYAVLTFDMRGHGDSIYKSTQLHVWRRFDANDWKKVGSDMDTLIRFVARHPEFKSVDTRRVALIGADIGSNIAIQYTSANKQHPWVHLLVLLSSGLEYQGIDVKDAISKIQVPAYFIASAEDSYAALSTRQLYGQITGVRKKLSIYKDLGHGTDMIDKNPLLSRYIATWVKRYFPINQQDDVFSKASDLFNQKEEGNEANDPNLEKAEETDESNQVTETKSEPKPQTTSKSTGNGGSSSGSKPQPSAEPIPPVVPSETTTSPAPAETLPVSPTPATPTDTAPIPSNPSPTPAAEGSTAPQ